MLEPRITCEGSSLLPLHSTGVLSAGSRLTASVRVADALGNACTPDDDDSDVRVLLEGPSGRIALPWLDPSDLSTRLSLRASHPSAGVHHSLAQEIPLSGEYSLSALVKGEHAQGSPIKFCVCAAPARWRPLEAGASAPHRPHRHRPDPAARRVQGQLGQRARAVGAAGGGSGGLGRVPRGWPDARVFGDSGGGQRQLRGRGGGRRRSRGHGRHAALRRLPPDRVGGRDPGPILPLPPQSPAAALFAKRERRTARDGRRCLARPAPGLARARHCKPARHAALLTVGVVLLNLPICG